MSFVLSHVLNRLLIAGCLSFLHGEHTHWVFLSHRNVLSQVLFLAVDVSFNRPEAHSVNRKFVFVFMFRLLSFPKSGKKNKNNFIAVRTQKKTVAFYLISRKWWQQRRQQTSGENNRIFRFIFVCFSKKTHRSGNQSNGMRTCACKCANTNNPKNANEFRWLSAASEIN